MLEPMGKMTDGLVSNLERQVARLQDQVLELQQIRARLEVENFRLKGVLETVQQAVQMAA